MSTGYQELSKGKKQEGKRRNNRSQERLGEVGAGKIWLSGWIKHLLNKHKFESPTPQQSKRGVARQACGDMQPLELDGKVSLIQTSQFGEILCLKGIKPSNAGRYLTSRACMCTPTRVHTCTHTYPPLAFSLRQTEA